MEGLEVTSQEQAVRNFWVGKRVLVTGHTGFKGSWLALWLHRRGALVTGISLPPATTPNLFSLARIDEFCSSVLCDIRDARVLAKHIASARPEIVFHLAAQPLVRHSYQEPLATFETNVMGTAHVLHALRDSDATKVVVLITTDKVYRNHEWVWPYREVDVLGGHDPYSASKAASEIVIESFRDAFLKEQGIAVATARAGNVIGGGDWSADRLIPDAIRAWQASLPLEVRRPDSVRPWQHVLEPLESYMTLARALWERPTLAGAFNFGPETSEAASVREVVRLASLVYGSGEVRFSERIEGPHEAGWLALEIAKSRNLLGVQPRWGLEEAVRRTMSWYRGQHQGADARSLCEADFAAYEAAA